ncbi:MAG: universal stress protein [Leptolyngbyaceae cyanobacterium MO_188.B28]|nr:universal stress protein [Leptolyngbyaceae cyanobacterium MO_188.B28]
MFQNALICTDFSDGLYRLVEFVPSLAAGGIKQITFFNNVPLEKEREIPRVDQDNIERSRDRLSAALNNPPPGVKVQVEVECGLPIDNILKLAQNSEADIIFLGMPTRTLLTEKLFGSTTMELTQQTPIPLLILRPQLISAYTTEELDLRCRHIFRYLLIPYDGSKSADYLVEQVKKRVQSQPDCALEKCLLCWILDEGVRKELQPADPLGEAQTKLEAAKAVLSNLDLEVNTEIRQGVPIEALLEAAEIHDITAIAVSSGSTSGFMKWSIPSFTSNILRRSWHPVMYFPPKSN